MIALGLELLEIDRMGRASWELSREALSELGEGLINTVAGVVGAVGVLGLAAAVAMPRWR